MDTMQTLIIFISVMTIILPFSLHRVEEGYLGVYYRAGALLPGTSKPGIHMMFPILTNYKPIQVTINI